MDDLTLGIIDAVKRGKKSGKESIIDFLSEYTGTPKEHYSDSKLNQWTIYVVEDVSGAYVDKYHYEVNFLPEMIIPVTITMND